MEPNPFLRNAWYVAAWEDEIGPDALFHRRILNDGVRVTWHPPSLMQLVVGAAPSGGPFRIGREQPGVHLMTPETVDSTHYCWSNSRDFRRDDAQLHEQIDQGLKHAFEHQDKPIIIAQQEAMNGEDFWDLKPLIFAGDAGAIRARRILRKLILAERGTSLEA
jgi:hypothetical protein